jgi:hypothetical protein
MFGIMPTARYTGDRTRRRIGVFFHPYGLRAYEADTLDRT